MDTLIGLVGKDYVLVAADASQAFSIIAMKTDEDKMVEVEDKKVMAIAGEAGDRAQFGAFIQKNLKLRFLRTGLPLSTKSTAHFVRSELATFLRQNPYMVNLLIAGYDEVDGPSLYYLDYLASMQKMEAASHGHGSAMVLSTMDAHYKPGMELEDGIRVLKMAISEVKKRFLIAQPKFIVKVVDAGGVRVLEDVF
uniref:Proteasome subunit beta n=1 Tax=Stygiella incarcerata TaxID=1712417 RepID=A0A192ZID6_9EUKA|nr:proteasome subunit beta type-2-A [Stygiella incarcerata]